MPNHLAGETSPYLKQHQDNPVDWYPWREEALSRAKQESKPIFLSIGYAACHWCHVMEHESFNDPNTAALMNENFINIKVDREERPDLDNIYMQAIVAMTRQGGWPMSVPKKRLAKPQPTNNTTPAVVRADELYSLEEAARRLRWRTHSVRQAKRAGLRVIRFGSRDYISGRAILEFFDRLAKDSASNP